MNDFTNESFFHGIMFWEQSGISFENKRVSTRVDKENLEAFFYTFHEDYSALRVIESEFQKYGISCEILPLSKYTKEKSGYVLETQRHNNFTKAYEQWYISEGIKN